ncbi:hypothetical protein ACFPZL_01100 [Leucobacter soli]|uniref:Uncharacterized protein n=1 Tax=Leucobacter soli TaxID=2812850 RepID=A0A916NI41_9MICO|nr:hypothetical protein [Leucobacter soli]CAG7618329.1 hypothetical protein LEUCIP111803_02193 [Leucobacter soli]
MTLKTLVYRDRRTGEWCADVALTDNQGRTDGSTWLTLAPSWAEAMQAAAAMRALLARLLMDQVHAERTIRRYGPIVHPTPEPTC